VRVARFLESQLRPDEAVIRLGGAAF